jgi:hypothetical protein
MKKLRLIALSSALWSVASIAQAEALKLKVGAAATSGAIGFTLTSDGESSHFDVALEPMPAPAKATAVQDAVATQDASGSWRANATGAALTFEHLVDGVWQNVDSISSVQDTTGAGSQIATKDGVLVFNLNLLQNAVATGLDRVGSPSFVTISVTNSLAWTRALQAGDTPESVLDLFAAFLAEQGEDTVQVVRVTPTVIVLRQTGDGSLSLSWQITDTGLLAEASMGVVDR